MALGRNHIVSKPVRAITMLCFNYTVGFPGSVPVLSRLFIADRRETTQSAARIGDTRHWKVESRHHQSSSALRPNGKTMPTSSVPA